MQPIQNYKAWIVIYAKTFWLVTMNWVKLQIKKFWEIFEEPFWHQSNFKLEFEQAFSTIE